MLNRAHKSFFGRCAVAAAGAAFLVGATLQPADAATVVWSGSQVNDTGSQWYAQNLGYAFDPNTSGTVITGTLDISQLLAGDTLMFGLIDKKHKDGNGYMWQSGAYLYLSMQNATTVRFGVSDGNVGGEIVQVFSDISRPANNTVDFSLTIQGGSITLTSLLLGASASRYLRGRENAQQRVWLRLARVCEWSLSRHQYVLQRRADSLESFVQF